MKTPYKIPVCPDGKIDVNVMKHDFNHILYGLEVVQNATPQTVESQKAKQELAKQLRESFILFSLAINKTLRGIAK